MLRAPITITNVNKWGKTTNKWYVRIGKRFRVFGEQDWLKNGVEWVNAQHMAWARDQQKKGS
ncbi:hypothetical protein MINTMi27_15830 [Mycobacterium intracellulare]|uniref:hypothetical protein n=1 Tax=Mycobacterium intracellulare TaxID=1767 RepID=UPI0019256A4D|nr:hypothetical protein [Mycobacterium intracellulare]BCP41490.1 hypothetical protein MINTMi27_15830 [Mycobacterium intracellulare]